MKATLFVKFESMIIDIHFFCVYDLGVGIKLIFIIIHEDMQEHTEFDPKGSINRTSFRTRK